MRVVYYTHPAFLEPALQLAREMSSLAEVHLLLEVSPATWQSAAFDITRQPLPPGLVPADPLLTAHFPAGVREYWRDLASFHLVVHTSRRSWDPAAWAVTAHALQFIRDLQPDLLHWDNVSRRVALSPFPLPRVPTVLSVHDPIPHRGEGTWQSAVRRRLMLARGGVDRYVVHNRALRAAFCRRYGVPEERTDVIHLGVYDILREWALPAVEPDERTVLFFGRLSSYKGLDTLYAAAPDVAASVPGVRFVVAGRPVPGYQPPPPPALPRGGSVEVVAGYVPNARLAALFGRATVVVCPYTDATQSGVVLTAYAFGRPVIATRVGGLPEYIRDGETGVLVPPDQPAALAAALIEVLSRPTLRRRLEEAARMVGGSDLSWRGTARRLLRVYEVTRTGRRSSLTRA